MITRLVTGIINKRFSGLIPVFFCLFIVLFNSSLYASKPLAAVIGVKAENIRVLALSGMLENQLNNVINSTGIFDLINPDLLKEQLARHGCMEEECVTAFAKTAGVNLIFRGFVRDKGDSLKLTLMAQGIDYPYFGKVVYKYSAIIPLTGLDLSPTEYNYICEEHAGYFISDCLKKYRRQTYIKLNKSNKPYIEPGFLVNGNFNVFRFEKIPGPDQSIRKAGSVGRVTVSGNIISDKPENVEIRENDFIFITYEKKAEFLEQVYYGRKREMVFYNRSSADTAVIFFSTVPLSILMPVAAPLTYYRNSDFSGLSLWAINVLPYLYLEYDGLMNRPETYEDDRRDVPGKSQARFWFGTYMFLFGGIPLVIDAFSNHMLYLAGSYQGKQPYVGNTASAVYLSLISGGGGLFYKGYRLQGYAYFHLHNILLYSFFKEMFAGKTYDTQTGTYVKEKINRKKAYTYLSAFALLKIIEITHVSLIRNNIRNGKQLEENFAFEPVIYENRNEINIGMQYSFRF